MKKLEDVKILLHLSFDLQDYEEIAKLEGRKDWTLAIEKSRKVLMELEPDDEYRVVELDDEVVSNLLWSSSGENSSESFLI